MQLFAVVSAAFLALSGVQADKMSTLHLRVQSGVSDWGSCTGGLRCSNPTSVCVKYSQWYAQCKPATLPQGELCGQNDGTNVWKYDYCPSNQKCAQVGTSTDFRCTNKKHHHKDHDKAGAPTTVADWGACTGGLRCTNPTSVCVKYSQYYAQCKPQTLPQGELCGQNDGTNVWKYDHCPSNQKCIPVGTDFRCTNKKHHHHKDHDKAGAPTTVADWGACTGGLQCSNPTSQCVRYSQWYAQCKPWTLPQGELCGQNDGTNVWKYDHCPNNQKCAQVGTSTDFRCTNKKHHHKDHDKAGAPTTVADWGACTGGLKCSNPTSICVKYSQYYAQCKPATLPQGELCGQNDGTNVWKYDHCPSNQKCTPVGTDFRCTNKKHHHKALEKDDSCTITNESQCDGQNWSGSTCCADPSYECRWSDDGQNVKRCQKIANQVDGTGSAVDSASDDIDDYSDSGYIDTSKAIDDDSDSSDDIDDYSESDDFIIIDYSGSESGSEDVIILVDSESGSDDVIIIGDDSLADSTSGSEDFTYSTYVDDWADCTKDDVGCATDTSVCVVHSAYYAQCKPETLPSGELCGQNDGTNVWEYDHCPDGETCQAVGTDFRCTA